MEKKLTPTNLLLGFQHLFAMFGATVVVPLITGLTPAVALITAGLGTLVFHLVTKRKVPVFLGSSFAYVPAIQILMTNKDGAIDKSQIPVVQGGIIVAGAIYLLLSLLVYFVGVEKIRKLFPPIVTGPVIVVIGLTLSPVAVNWAAQNWAISIITLAIVIGISIFAKGFFKLVPILIGMFSGYVLCILSDVFFPSATKLVDFSSIINAPWISPFWDFTSGAFFTLPRFELSAIILIAPIALVTFMEHIGDITTNSSVVGKDFLKDPGLHRTLLGDGLATILAGCVGGPANTTYSENTGVLAVTKNYNPFVLRLAAMFAILLGLFGKFGAVLTSIPFAVIGGVCILLYGMIASVGLRTISEADLDFSQSRNLIVIALILVIGVGLSGGVDVFGVKLSGLFLAVFVGALVNKLLPQDI